MAVLLLTYLADIILLRCTNCNSEFEAEDENHKVPSSRLPSSSCWLGSGSTCCYNGTGHGTWKTAGDMDGGWKREKGKVLIVGTRNSMGATGKLLSFYWRNQFLVLLSPCWT